MFCAASQKLLHRRSQKKLRDTETPTHKRQNSAWSESSRTSSSSGSESSRRDGSTVEWDPLRLHPAMAPEPSSRCVERRYQHQEEAKEKHLLAHRQHSYQHFRQHRPAHSQPGFSLEIYDGFDFGFGAPLPGMAQSGGARPLRAPRSESDLRHQRHSSPEPAEWGESQPPSPSRRPLPASLNEADYFLKRGGWKRRGIVFASDEPTATDDDVFEIP